MKKIIYENQVLRNTNYYLLCTIYNLEKQKIDNYKEYLNLCKVTSEGEELLKILSSSAELNDEVHILKEKEKEEEEEKENINLMNKLEEKKGEYDILNNELQNLKIKMEVQRDFSEHKILNLELAKNLLEQELLNKQDKYESEILENEELMKKGKEIDKLKRENEMLTINNQQLQYELIRAIKQMQ
jgi:hypothetical protein